MNDREHVTIDIHRGFLNDMPNSFRVISFELLKLYEECRPVYTTANFGYGTDKNSTGTKK